MAKASSKSPIKKSPAPKKKSSPSPDELIVKACEVSLAKLSELNIEHQLQSEINWCLGSYNNDHNPVGLYQMTDRSIAVFRDEKAKKTKGVTAAFIANLEKAMRGA